MTRGRDVTGLRVGTLVAAYRVSTEKGLYWLCNCDCGGTRLVRSSTLWLGRIKSCGCSDHRGNFKHGGRRTPEYAVWSRMVRRCHNPDAAAYNLYGGRGITVCEAWRKDFAAFIADMGPRPSSKHSIDRINTNGGYSPDNCRWATALEQVRNRRTTVRIDGIPLAALTAAGSVKYATAHKRLMDGRPLDIDVANAALKHTFQVHGSSLTISQVAKLIGKSYNQAYHLLVTREVALEDLLC